MDFIHAPVLLGSVVEHLVHRRGGRWLDGTLGGGGHAEAVLQETGPEARLVGIDRDPGALAAAEARLAQYRDQVQTFQGRFADMATLTGGLGPFDGILLDLGVSSPQLDTPGRGFSIQKDGPVDMRMDPSQEQDASGLLEQLDEAGLVDILRRYGEEPRARRIARAILQGRPWHSTHALAECVAVASGWKGSRVHPATRTFQALRIAVNDELGQLERGLDAALSLLCPGGRLAVISFHSLEDRIVKKRFRTACAIGTPRDVYGHPITPPIGRRVLRKPISGKDADSANPRARSARLRVIERLPISSSGPGSD